MPVGILFWVLMVLWVVLGLFGTTFGAVGVYGVSVLPVVLFGLLGWKVFGPVLQ